MKRIAAALAAFLLTLTLATARADALVVTFQHTGGGFGTNTWLYYSPWEDTTFYGYVYDASITLNCDETNAYSQRWVTLDIEGGIGPSVVMGWTVHADTSHTWQVPTNTLDVRFVVNSQGCQWTVRLFRP